MSMEIEKAIEIQKSFVTEYKCKTIEESEEIREFMIVALEELQQYLQIGTVDECRSAREKQIPKEPKRVYIKNGKHEWKKREDGEIDYFAWSSGYCNGVVCEVCGETVCIHCHPDYEEMQDCEGEYFLCPNCGRKHYEKSACCECGQILKWGD